MAKSKRVREFDDFDLLDFLPPVAGFVPLQEILKQGTIFRHRGRKIKIEKIEWDVCKDWRTHVHLNKSMCFDLRTLVIDDSTFTPPF